MIGILLITSNVYIVSNRGRNRAPTRNPDRPKVPKVPKIPTFSGFGRLGKSSAAKIENSGSFGILDLCRKFGPFIF